MDTDGFAWIADDLAPRGFHLRMVKGMGVAELADKLGADPCLGVLAPDTFNAVLRASRGPLPDRARLGEHAGWAFALHTGDPFLHGSEDAEHLWAGHTVLSVLDTETDPPTVDVLVDNRLDWAYFEGEVNDGLPADHPLTVRMRAEIGLGSAYPDPDFPDEPEEWGLHVPPERDVHRLPAEHYGLALPRRAVLEDALPGVFTAPRVRADGEPDTRYGNVRLP